MPSASTRSARRRPATRPDEFASGDSPPRKRSFPPVVDARTRLLVLGSLPGERSLAAEQYYAHPQNQFWRLMEAATGVRLVEVAYPSRLAALLDARIGLWDVVASATRPGSLDASIKDAEANDLAALVATLPDLRTIAFNGATASTIGRKSISAATSYRLLDLPSSSPAYTLPFAAKAEAWSVLGATSIDYDG